MKNLLITGGAGFIGTNFIRFVLPERPSWKIIILDALAYAGNPMNFEDNKFLKKVLTFSTFQTNFIESFIYLLFWEIFSMAKLQV